MASFPAEKFKHETLDHLGATMALFVATVQVGFLVHLLCFYVHVSGDPRALESRH